jgi:RNA polymerase sigma factor (sigma-70 family)
MQSTLPPDSKVLKRVQTAYEILENHKELVHATINTRMNNTMEADDVFQDFFLSLVDKPIPTNLENIGGYLRRAISNDLIDEARRSKHHKEQLRGYTQYKRATARKDDPPAVIARTEVMSKVLSIIHTQLPRHEAQVVLARCYHDQNADQTAEAMSVNKRTVSRYLCIGLQKIRKSLANNLADTDCGARCRSKP